MKKRVDTSKDSIMCQKLKHIAPILSRALAPIAPARAGEVIRGALMRIICIFAVAIVGFSSCELFTTSPFPEYLGNVVAAQDFSSHVQEVFPNLVGARYRLFSLRHSGKQHIYLVITPPLDVDNLEASRGAIFYMDELGNFQKTIRIPNEDAYSLRSNFGAPFLLSNSGDAFSTDSGTQREILAGNVTLNPETHEVVRSVLHSLSGGYGLALQGTMRAGTYLFSGESGASSYFKLEVVAFNDATDASLWGQLASGANKKLIPIAREEGSNAGSNGYVLRGIVPVTGGQVIFLLEHLGTEVLHLWTLTEAQIINYHKTTLLPGDEPLSSIEEYSSSEDNSNTRQSISLAGSKQISYGDDEIIIYRDSGLLERYDMGSGILLDSIRAEVRSGILYAFSSDGKYMYRFDPETLRLRVMSTWWTR